MEFTLDNCDTIASLLAAIPSIVRGWDRRADIAIATPYQAQYELYRRAFARLKRGAPQFGLLNVRKIDGYQGGEAKFVILDMVITDEPGFVADRNRHRNRVNVGLTRCRDGLFLVGDVQASRTIKRSKRGHYVDFLTRRDL